MIAFIITEMKNSCQKKTVLKYNPKLKKKLKFQLNILVNCIVYYYHNSCGNSQTLFHCKDAKSQRNISFFSHLLNKQALKIQQ